MPGRFFFADRLLMDVDILADHAPRTPPHGPRFSLSRTLRLASISTDSTAACAFSSLSRRAAFQAEFQGALAWTTGGATLAPLRALARFSWNETGSGRASLQPQSIHLVAASDSWPLFGVRLSADSRLGPLSDPSGACRKCTKASPWVALWPAPQGRAPNSEAAHHPFTPASMRAGGRPSRTVCGPSHGASPTTALSPKDGCLQMLRIKQGRGPRSLRSGLRPDPRQFEAERRDALGFVGALRELSVDSVRTLRMDNGGRLCSGTVRRTLLSRYVSLRVS